MNIIKLIKRKYLEYKATKRYRVVQISDDKFIIERYGIYQIQSRSGNTGYPVLGWREIKLSWKYPPVKEDYVKYCQWCRDKYVKEHLYIKDTVAVKYPKVIY